MNFSNLLRALLVLTVFGAHADEVDDYVRAEMKKQDIPGLSLAVVKSGVIEKTAGYGIANLEWSTPVNPETVFQIQSVTKTFTATSQNCPSVGSFHIDVRSRP